MKTKLLQIIINCLAIMRSEGLLTQKDVKELTSEVYARLEVNKHEEKNRI